LDAGIFIYYSGMERVFPSGAKLRTLVGDITKIPADAIVNAANSALAGGGGVDGAIHRAGGPSIMRELDEIRARIGRCPAGDAVVTGAGALPAKWVFHAVGPIYRDGRQGEPELLRACYQTCLRLADERKVRTITFPAISTGAYGYPLADAALIAIDAISEHLARAETSITEAAIVLFDQRAFDAFEQAARSRR
jgi:O-acetyl-ADP-ribose deacetylase (regulator of RNase III)